MGLLVETCRIVPSGVPCVEGPTVATACCMLLVVVPLVVLWCTGLRMALGCSALCAEEPQAATAC
eukprot:1145584-Pelagomonas_calceolata.AAC.2